jgi:hypothetical protein
MKRLLIPLLFICPVFPALTSADAPHTFHFGLKAEPEGNIPMAFPFGLETGQSKVSATAALEAKGFQRDNYDKDFTFWDIPAHSIEYKTFKPTSLALTYRNDKLIQATLVQPAVEDCQDIMTIFQDSIDYIKHRYVYSPENIRTSPQFGSNNCVSYMKSDQNGWEVVTNDYAVSIDSNWKNLKYSLFVTYTNTSLYDSK